MTDPPVRARLCFCVSEFLPSSASFDLSGTDSALYPFEPQEENFQDIWLPSTSMYPYYLFPGIATARTAGRGGDPWQPSHRGHDTPELPGSGSRDPSPPLSPSADSGHERPDNNVEIPHSPYPTLPSSQHEHLERENAEHAEHRHRHGHDYPAPAQPAQPASSARPTPTVDESNPAPPDAPGTRKFAPRPTYEHGAAFDRPDDELDELDEFRIARLPVDRLFDLEAFEGFVDQGS